MRAPISRRSPWITPRIPALPRAAIWASFPESSLNQSDPSLKENRAGDEAGPDSPSRFPVKGGGYRILKLTAKETAGQREITDPEVQQGIRDMLHNRQEQLLRSSYMAEARDDAHVTNVLAAQILESAGKLPTN